jgi:hypothetical protein
MKIKKKQKFKNQTSQPQVKRKKPAVSLTLMICQKKWIKTQIKS